MYLVPPTWVLGVARRYAANPKLRVAAAFAAGNGLAPPVHRAQVGRWESSELGPSYELVRRYETVCGLRPGQLTAAIDLIYRDASPVDPAVRLQRPLSDGSIAEAQDLLDSALADRPLSGAQWDHLSGLLEGLPATLMLSRDWSRLVTRGVRELDVAVGLGYLHRSEAMARIAGHPRARRSVVAAVSALLESPDAQVYGEAAALLMYCPDPGVAAVVTNSICQPVNGNALRAGLYIATNLIRQGRIPEPMMRRMWGAAAGNCRDPAQPYRVRRAAADLLSELPPAWRRKFTEQLRGSISTLSSASIVSGNGPYRPEDLRSLEGRIRECLAATFGPAIHEETPLWRLLHYINTEANDERRGHALQVMMLLPFGAAVGHAYVAELSRALERDDLLAVHELLGVLVCLTPADDIGLLGDLAVRSLELPADTDQVAVEACWALGNAQFGPPTDPGLDERLQKAVGQMLEGRASAAPRLQEAWAYALGMRGRVDLVRQLEVPSGAAGVDAWAAARAWWCSLPGYLKTAGTS